MLLQYEPQGMAVDEAGDCIFSFCVYFFPSLIVSDSGNQSPDHCNIALNDTAV